MRPLLLLAATFAALTAHAQDFTPDLRAKVDAAIERIVQQTGVPSASVGVVYGGRIAYTRAFGDARLSPVLPATAAMPYPIGSISKQFTAACILALAEDGKLTLDDPVARWFPSLTRASDITLRELLSHTSGYEDYAPQDYTIPAWTRPVDPVALVREWASKPLDFEPGTQWQYSNTNFVLAALIVERASGMPYFDFLQQRILRPAGLEHVLDLGTDRARLPVQGYERRALAPLRPATLEAPGWYFGDGALAMPVADLLRWDLSILNRTVLKPASYDAFETPTRYKNGTPSNYSLGLFILTQKGRRIIEHSGEVGGFVSENILLPDSNIAIAVLTNQEASSAAEQIAKAIDHVLLPAAPQNAQPADGSLARIQSILAGLQNGQIDRTLFTPDANFYFSPETLGDFSSSLKPLGTPTEVTLQSESLRGGMQYRAYRATFSGGRSATISTYTMPNGKLEQFLVEATN